MKAKLAAILEQQKERLLAAKGPHADDDVPPGSAT